MGLIIENISGSVFSINDLGLGLEAGSQIDLALYSDPVNVASSAQAGGDLYAAINGGAIAVKDPLDDVTNLTSPEAISACQSHNDPHWRMPPAARIVDALDVNAPGVVSDEVLQFNGTSWVNVDPSSIGGSGSFQLSWRFDTSTTASNPGSKKYRFDTVTTAAISEIYINDISDSGVDASVLLSVLKAGDKIYVQQTDDASTAFLFTVTAAATDNIGWFTIPVSVDSEVGFLPGNNKVCSWVLMYGLGAGSSQNLWEKIVADDGFIVAATPTDTFGIAGGTAIDTTVSMVTNTITIDLDETVINHANILNVGTNTHAQLDTHVSDATIHFTEGSIDHENILNIGTNTHADIDTHISDATIHFTEASIDHENILNIGTNSHADIDTHISDATIHFTEASIDHTVISNIGTNSHADIDTHIGDGTIHFTEASIDHTAITNIGTNSHANIDTHIADGTIHFTEGSISHLNISDIGTNTHAAIDAHIGDATIHFTEGSISHLNISDIGTNTHAAIDAHLANAAIHFTEASIDHTAITNIGTNSHDDIDTHIGDGTIHFTEASIDHTAITNIGTNSHADIDSHLADGTIHFTEGSISHLNISDIGTNTHAAIDAHIAANGNPHDTSISNLADTTITAPANTEVLTYSGGEWVNLPSAESADLASVTLGVDANVAIQTTFTNVDWQNTHVENNTAVIEHDNTNIERSLIKETGLYLLAYSMSFDADAGEESISGQFVIDDTTVVPGSLRTTSEDDEINDLSNVITAELTAGTYITFQAMATGAGNAIESSTTMSIMRARGIKGDIGATGAGSNVIIQDEGVAVPNTPHSTLNFTGAAVTATDAGSGVTNIAITGGGGTASDNPSVSASRTTTQAITATWVNVSLNSTNVENDVAIVEHNNTNTDRVDVKEDGLYQVTYNVSGTKGVNGRLRVNDTTVIPGTDQEGTLNSGFVGGNSQVSATATVELTSGDYISLQITQSSGQDNTLIVGASVTVTRLSGQQGATGPQGPAGAAAILEDEGTPVTGAPHNTYNFVGAGVAVTNAGGGEATITISGGGAGSGTFNTIQDEGTPLSGTPHDTINFTGTGVTATNASGGVVDVAIPTYTPPSISVCIRNNGAATQTWTTTATTITFPTNEQTDVDYTYGAGEVTINAAGWYRVDVDVTYDQSAGNSRSETDGYLEIDTGGGFATMPGSATKGYSRSTAQGAGRLSSHKLHNFGTGDVIRYRVIRDSGNATFQSMANGCQLTIEKR